MILVIDDNDEMAGCIGRATRRSFHQCRSAIEAMAWVSDDNLPEMIFLDILLDGPDGFEFLNELVSYPDTAQIPVVVVSGLKFAPAAFQDYNVVGMLNKETMRPVEVRNLADKYLRPVDESSEDDQGEVKEDFGNYVNHDNYEIA